MFNIACHRSGVYTCRLQSPKVREVINKTQQENAVILFLLFWHALAKKLALLFNYKPLEKGRHIKLKEIPICLIPCPLFFLQARFLYAAYAPATWPPVLPGILFRYENRSSQQHRSSHSLPQACLRSWLEFTFAGMPAVKLCDGSSCLRRMFSFVREVAQVVPAATLQIQRRHMRTRLAQGS